MAAIDIPWLTHMSTPRRQRGDTSDSAASSIPVHDPSTTTTSYLTASASSVPPTYASFSPATLSASSQNPVSAAKRLSTILVHQKSPLLLATPPQVTRALAYSHPFLLPLNKLAGLLTWTTGDPWESFLLVALFWAVVLYGDVAIRFAGPLVLVLLLIGGMYGRRYSPLSSSGWGEDGVASGGTPVKGSARKNTTRKGKASSGADNTGSGGRGADDKTSLPAPGTSGGAGGGSHSRVGSEATHTKHQKTLDEIVETLKELTARCNILLEPLLELTDFLSTQRTATSATTRPALTRLFVRLILCTPFWVALTLPPLRVITTRRVVLCFGTIVLTWHARVVKAGRTILWRSASVRRLAALVSGLEVVIPKRNKVPLGKKSAAQEALEKMQRKAAATTNNGSNSRESELTKAIRRARGATDAGVRFTFIIYENQRRWVGLGWTTSMFSYERSAWTDEHNNPVPPREQFQLPEVEEDSAMRWRWVEGSRWRVDGVPDEAVHEGEKWDYDGDGGKNGWVFYDNKWQNGRRGQDGWGRWTRRRKWYRDAELVEIGSDDETEDTSVEAGNGTGTGTGTGKKPEPPSTPTPRSERVPSLPPRPQPTSPTLAGPYISDGTNESMSMPDLISDRKSDTLEEIKEEGEDKTEANEKVDDVSSVLSTSSRSMRFRMPMLRRRVTDSSSKQQPNESSSVTSSPRSGVGRRSRRTSEVNSEDEAASLERTMGLAGKGNRVESWGFGDEVVMGLD